MCHSTTAVDRTSRPKDSQNLQLLPLLLLPLPLLLLMLMVEADAPP
jgi:hypothetical protein